MPARAASPSSQVPGALVYAHDYTGLGVARSLGRQGIPVFALGTKYSLAGVSRFVQHATPLQGADEAAKVDFLIELAKKHHLKDWVLFPDGDRNVALLARNYDALSEYYTPTVPPWDVVKWALDKRLTYQIADELSIDHPKTFYPTTAEEAEQIDGPFPMILKPAHHEGTDRFSAILGAWRADTRQELVERFRDASDAVAGQGIVTVQEMIPGGGEAHLCYAAVCEDGIPLAHVFVRRTRISPIEFGRSAFAETVEPIPQMEQAARAWLARVGYTGLADFDFKYHEGSGRYCLLDVNLRPWGWHPLATYAGVDFPYLMWLLALGRELPPSEYVPGVKWIRLPYDASSAMTLMRRGELTWGAYLESLRGAHFEMYESDDLLPALREIPLAARLLWHKLRGR